MIVLLLFNRGCVVPLLAVRPSTILVGSWVQDRYQHKMGKQWHRILLPRQKKSFTGDIFPPLELPVSQESSKVRGLGPRALAQTHRVSTGVYGGALDGLENG